MDYLCPECGEQVEPEQEFMKIDGGKHNAHEIRQCPHCETPITREARAGAQWKVHTFYRDR